MPGTITFKHGTPLMVDYTAGTAVSANTIVAVVDNQNILIAHGEKAANELDGYAYPNGNGVYLLEGFDLGAGTTDFSQGDKVYYDTVNEELDDTSGSNVLLGTVISTGAAQTDDLLIVAGV